MRALYFCPVVSFFLLFSSPNLSGRILDVYHTSTHGVALVRFRSEMCCTRLAGNTGRKNYAKNRHLRTIAQLFRAVSSQLRHVSTVGKTLLNSNIFSRPPHNTANFGPLMAESCVLLYWQRYCTALQQRASAKLCGVEQEGATYGRQGDHHVGHWPTFIVTIMFQVVVVFWH